MRWSTEPRADRARNNPAASNLVGADPAARRLLAAYALRQRAYRRAGAVLVLLAALTVQVAPRSGSVFEVRLGVGGSFWTNVVALVFAGSLAGAIVAELHHLRRRRTGVHTAELATRHFDDYASRRLHLGLWVGVLCVGVIAVLAAAWPALVGGSTDLGSESEGVWPLWLPVVASLLVAGAVELTARRVIGRPRPALRPAMRSADEQVRRMAVNSSLLTRGVALVLLALTWAVIRIPSEDAAVTVAANTVAGLVFVAAVLLVVRSGRRDAGVLEVPTS